MAGLPDIHVAGTLTADPELRFTPSGAAVANFTVAANDRRLDPDTKQWVDSGATFLRCSIWRGAAENVAESLRKGDRVMVSGALRQREYETDGQKRYAFEVTVFEVGPSLKWATAKVAKATRSTGTATAADAWGSAPAGAATGGGFSEEPPF